MERDLTAAQTRGNWSDYYSSISGSVSNDEFESEFKKYVGTHTWHNSIRVISSNCTLKPGSTVLDAGCGWGRLLLGITESHQNLSITAIDQSEEALEIGRRVLGQPKNMNEIDWQQGDLQSLPFDDNTFDTVYSARVFQHLNEPSKAAREITRVLKPNGRLLVIVQNKLCPLNMAYYSRLYTPKKVRSWFDGVPLTDINTTTMDFYPTALRIPKSVESRMQKESALEKTPLFRWLGGKVVVSGTK